MNFKRFILRLLPILLVVPALYLGFVHNRTQDANKAQPVQERGPLNPADEFTRPEPSFQQESIAGTIVTPTLSRPVVEIPILALSIQPELIREVNPRISHNLPTVPAEIVQNLLVEPETFSGEAIFQRSTLTSTFTTPILNFEGAGFSGVQPPDTVGAIGKNYFIQIINNQGGSQFSIYDRSGNEVSGPTQLDSLGSGLCANGAGDAIVIYDQLAERWFMSEFHKATGNVACHYVSQTADPLGSWHAYQFITPFSPDYAKYGLWPTAYLGTANELGINAGPAIYAFDREKMLAGEPAGFVRFQLPPISGFGFQALTPVDFDGLNLPATPGSMLFLRHRDDELHNSAQNNPSADFIEIWQMSADFDNPSGSSFAKLADILIPEFDSTMCDVGLFSCVPQPGAGVKLDPLREVLMHRVQYRNFGTHQSIVGNMVTDINGNDLHGIFWFELRNTGGTWSLFQSGRLFTNDEHRWMGSIGMDAAQNIGIFYNVSGNSTFPSLRYAGRTADMLPGTLLPQEGIIAEGQASNINKRYGDYSSLTLDPVDDCTFWATGQYNPAPQWSTRIATFRFPNCSKSPTFLLQADQPAVTVLAGQTAVVPILVSATDDFTRTVSLSVDGLTSGTITSVSPLSLTPTATPTLVTVTVENSAVGEQSFVLTGESDTQLLQITVPFAIVLSLTEPTSLISPKDGALYVPILPNLSWTAVNGATAYEIEIGTDASFVSVTQTITDVKATSFKLSEPLQNDTAYFWRVRPVNDLSNGPWAAGSFRTEPPFGLCQSGETAETVYQTGFEDGLSGWESSGTNSSWQITSGRFLQGAFSVMGTGHGFQSTQNLASPTMTLAPLADIRWLSFDSWRDLESGQTSCHDGLTLEVEQNGVWESVVSTTITDPYSGPITQGSGNQLQGDSWCGQQDWTTNLINLSAYSGATRIRFRLGTDDTVGREGVYIDNVHVFECNPRQNAYYFPIVKN